MSSADAPSVATLTQQMEVLLRETDSLMQAMARARKIRMALFLALVAFVAVTCWTFYQAAMRFQSDENRQLLLKTAQDRLSQNSDNYMRQVQGLVDRTSPILTTAFYDQAKKDMPSYLNAVEKERDSLVNDLQTKLEQKLTAEHKKATERQEKLLQQEFPTFKDADLHARMIHNMQGSVDKLVKKYYVDEMHNEMTALLKGWDNFPAAERPKPTDPPLEDQLIGNLITVLQYRLAHVDSPVHAAP